MVFHNKRTGSQTDHEHSFVTHNVGADLQRRVCAECSHVSVDLMEPASVRSEVNGKKPGLFGGAPELVYELAEALALVPATVADRPRFGERRTERRR
jgi:hypothetical protein